MKAQVIVSVLVLWAALAFVGALPVQGTASDTHYLVGSGCDPVLWEEADCWSHTSGGLGGEEPPTITNPVVIDDASDCLNLNALTVDAFAASLTITDTGGCNLTLSAGVDLTMPGSIFISGAGAETFIILSDTSILSVGGMISASEDVADAGLFTSVPTGKLDYAGSGDFTGSGVSVQNIEAVDETFYCFPNCIDGGGNINVVFEAAPSPPPSLLDVSVIAGAGAALLIAVVLIGVSIGFMGGLGNAPVAKGMNVVQIVTLVIGMAIVFFVLVFLALPLLGG